VFCRVNSEVDTVSNVSYVDGSKTHIVGQAPAPRRDRAILLFRPIRYCRSRSNNLHAQPAGNPNAARPTAGTQLLFGHHLGPGSLYSATRPGHTYTAPATARTCMYYATGPGPTYTATATARNLERHTEILLLRSIRCAQMRFGPAYWEEFTPGLLDPPDALAIRNAFRIDPVCMCFFPHCFTRGCSDG
jgi:hypothetical protein